MMANFLPEIASEDKEVLKAFAKNNSHEFATLKRVVSLHLQHFRDIRNVDPRLDNVGLQACSHLRAYDMLEEIFGQIDLYDRLSEEKKNKGFK